MTETRVDRQLLGEIDASTTELLDVLRPDDATLAAAARQHLDELALERAGQPRRATPSVTVVIPTLNEAANLPHVLPRIPAEVDEVLIVDGHSVDDTVAVALKLRPDAQILHQDGRGKGNALACGFEAARGDIVVMLDADGSTDPAEIPCFLEALIDGADFVKGSRSLPGGGSDDLTRIRAAGNKALTATVNLLYRTRYTDLCYGYNAFWRRCLDHMPHTCDGFEVETLLGIQVARAGLDVREVPSVEHQRLNGESNLRAVRDGLRVLRTILRERVRRSPAPVTGTNRRQAGSGSLAMAGGSESASIEAGSGAVESQRILSRAH